MKKLQEYFKKRNFNETGEPSGEINYKRKNKKDKIFVVQHHLARKEHYDFRLEWKGVLLSFAVPKGPSFNPKDKRLAIQVENHPIDYSEFEGTIPKGQYGGGTVMLWDSGVYKELNNFTKGLKEGVLKFELFGNRLNGKWTLVKFDIENENNNWLLIKEKDEFINYSYDIEKYNTSIKSGKTMEEIAENSKNKENINKNKEKINENQEKTVKKLNKTKNPFNSVDLELCTLLKEVPLDKDFVYELKYDGYRIVCFAEQGEVKLFTRNKKDYTNKFKNLANSLQELSQNHSFVIDGEVVVLDNEGKPNFQELQNFLKNSKNLQPTFMIFDLLALDGVDLRKKTFLERKSKLYELLKNSQSNLCYVEHFEGNGKSFFNAVSKMGLEGVIAKKKDSKYIGGRGDDWFKIKCRLMQEFVVGGFLSSEKKNLSAIILGCYTDDKFQFLGKCGTGFNDMESKLLLKKFENLKTQNCPFLLDENNKNKIQNALKFHNIFKKNDNSFLTWLKPKIVVQIEYAELTKDGFLRQASFKGIREDKDAKQVVLEETKNYSNKENLKNNKKNAIFSKKSIKKSDFSIFDIKISHPDKIIFKKPKITKMEIAKYYECVSERMMDYVKDRPLSVLRCSNSALNCFYKKHPTVESDNVECFYLTNDDGEKQKYFSLKDKVGLIEQVQLGTLEFHIWGTKANSLDNPDYMVFDLDPDSELGIDRVRQGVKDLKKILDKLKLKSFLKTSGGKGYHICVPFAHVQDWQSFHDFAEKIAKLMESKWPERYTTNIRKENRKGKIFVDFMRNTRGATSVAPYSVRARVGAKVSCPIFWSELDKISPEQIDMQEAISRLNKKDPWKEMKSIKQKLVKLS